MTGHPVQAAPGLRSYPVHGQTVINSSAAPLGHGRHTFWG